ncbi:hypothetical protein HYR99_33870 [Candidatus Poribacteria bacterium]|nr:hypothetical protein [Candidatus Poribacteria bacterium]
MNVQTIITQTTFEKRKARLAMTRLIAAIVGLFVISMAPVFGQETQQPPAETISNPSSPLAPGPTWLLTIPTADTLDDGRYELGLIQGGTIPFHADLGGVWDNLEVGIHGVKLRLLKEGSPWASFAVGATFGYYPAGAYVVGSKTLSGLRAHLGARFFPFEFGNNTSSDNMSANDTMNNGGNNSSTGDDRPVIVFGGIEKTIPKLNNARLLLEVGDSLAGGVRFALTSAIQVDVGVRAALPEKLERSLGKRGSVISYASRETTAYLGISFSSDFKSPVKTNAAVRY